MLTDNQKAFIAVLIAEKRNVVQKDLTELEKLEAALFDVEVSTSASSTNSVKEKESIKERVAIAIENQSDAVKIIECLTRSGRCLSSIQLAKAIYGNSSNNEELIERRSRIGKIAQKLVADGELTHYKHSHAPIYYFGFKEWFRSDVNKPYGKRIGEYNSKRDSIPRARKEKLAK